MSTAQDIGAMLGGYGEEDFLAVTEVAVDPNYQRDHRAARVRSMTRDFDPRLFGRLVVSLRADGSYRIVDGQHRWLAAKAKGVKRVPCLVYKGWDIRREAEVFRLLNETQTRVTPYQRHRAALVAGHNDARDIQAIIEEAGFEISSNNHPSNPRQVACIDMLYRIYRLKSGKQSGREYLRQTLRLIMEAWGELEYPKTSKEIRPLNVDIILGLATFLWRADADPNFGEDRLLDIMRRTTPHKLVQSATSFLGQKASLGVALKIKEAYNNSRRSRALGNWPIEALRTA